MALLQWLTTASAGVVFGLALAAPPGPMNAVIAQESVVGGWRAGFTAGLGAMVADACFLGLSLAGVVAILQHHPRLQALMIGVGGLLLWYFAVDTARDLAGSFGLDDAETTDRRGFLKAFSLAVTNPYQILFWLTVGVGLLEPGEVDVLATTLSLGPQFTGLIVVQTGSPLLLGGLFGGIALWISGFPLLLAAGRGRIDRFAPTVAALSAVAYALFGTVFVLDAVWSLR